MTTEAQTLEYVLMSPGLIEKLDPVATTTCSSSVRKSTSGSVHLSQGGRNELQSGTFSPCGLPSIPLIPQRHACRSPRQPTARAIAKHIAALSATAAERKRVYHGLRALTAVCVGDIVMFWPSTTRCSDAVAQSVSRYRRRSSISAFRLLCPELYHLNHRDGRFKDAALGFAQAARDLLVDSARKNGRLRQYSSIYVRVTTEDTEEQFEQLRNPYRRWRLCARSGAPRTKTRDDDPVQQFILKYRKLFGLASLIGLADRDRFELSGNDLREWLAEPKRGRDILKRNLGGPLEEADEPERHWTKPISLLRRRTMECRGRILCSRAPRRPRRPKGQKGVSN